MAKTFCHTGEAPGDLLEPLQPAHVGLDRFAARTRPGGRDRIGGLHQDRGERARLDLVVMGLDGVHDGRVLAEPPADLGADHGMRTAEFVADGLADVVEERGPPRLLLVDPQLGGEDACHFGGLDQVVQHVLAVATSGTGGGRAELTNSGCIRLIPTSSIAHSPASRTLCSTSAIAFS